MTKRLLKRILLSPCPRVSDALVCGAACECIWNEFSGDVDAAGPGTTLRELLL